MKFTVSSSTLFYHLQSISRVIVNKSTLPILENFLFELEGNQLAITASDQETTMTTSLEVENAEGIGKVALSSRTLLESLKEFSEQPLTFDINENNLSIVILSGNGKFDFIGQNGDEFPIPAEISDDATSLDISTADLLTGISYTLFATSDDELRPVMNGIYFDIFTENLTFVASDGHKLVRFSNANVKGTEKAAFVLPKKPATLLKNVLAKEEGSAVVKFDGKNACFELANYKMYCRLIESRFPDYNAVIPKNNPYKVIVDRTSLLSVIRRVSAFSSPATKLIKIKIAPNEIEVSAQDIDFSCSAVEKIACQYDGEQNTIGFKSNLLIEILSNITSKDIIFELGENSRPGIILPFEQEENNDLLMLLMPMLIN